MQSSDSSDKQHLLERFGPLLSLSADSLITLASNIRHRISGIEHSPNARLVSQLSGSYNLVYIVEFADAVRYVIRIPATGWGDRFTETAKRAFTSQARTMRLIAEQSGVPLPKVYEFDATMSNEIGAPYIVMSFIPGCTVASKWFDKTGPTDLEERRLRTLETVAEAMSQLQKFRFEKIRSLQFSDATAGGEIGIGPCYEYDEGVFGDEDYEQKLAVDAFGPFTTSQSYLQYHLNHRGNPQKRHPLGVGAQKLVAMMIPYLPRPRNGHETFVLALPDFDSQNIMIDERGNLTGIVDWDNVQAVPAFLGYSRFPGWITRDWDPLMYGYPHIETEDSPEELRRYRRWYASRMKQLLNGRGESRFTGKSHIFEAVTIAAMSEVCRLEIVRKIVERVSRGKKDFDSLGFIENVGEGRLKGKDRCRLEKKFQALLSISGRG